MRTAIRWTVAAVIVVHGLIHFLGAAKGLGWADVTALSEPITPGIGLVWLAAGILTVGAGVLLAVGIRWWWIVGAVALVLSQAVIISSWSDAKAGTIANVVLLAAVIFGYASQGPTSYRAQFHRLVGAALADSAGATTGAVVTESDLAHLPDSVARYVRQSGAVGLPRVRNFRARAHGRIRGGADKPWMSFVAEQVNTYGPAPSRLFFMDATMVGLPVDVLHAYVGPSATMRVKVCSLVPMVNAAGPEMDRAETVTVFNDLCVLTPAALVDAPISWQVLDERHVRGSFTNGAQTVTAELTFNDADELVDFVSDDRTRASADGKSFTPQRWSTPIGGYRLFGDRRIGADGQARWHPVENDSGYCYLEFFVDSIAYNEGISRAGAALDDRQVSGSTR